jgi:regulator of replication initiation timing
MLIASNKNLEKRVTHLEHGAVEAREEIKTLKKNLTETEKSNDELRFELNDLKQKVVSNHENRQTRNEQNDQAQATNMQETIKHSENIQVPSSENGHSQTTANTNISSKSIISKVMNTFSKGKCPNHELCNSSGNKKNKNGKIVHKSHRILENCPKYNTNNPC